MSFLIRCEDNSYFGFVAANTVKEAFIAVDIVTDPYSVEYVKMPEPEGIFFQVLDKSKVIGDYPELGLEITNYPNALYQGIVNTHGDEESKKYFALKWKVFTKEDSWVTGLRSETPVGDVLATREVLRGRKEELERKNNER